MTKALLAVSSPLGIWIFPIHIPYSPSLQFLILLVPSWLAVWCVCVSCGLGPRPGHNWLVIFKWLWRHKSVGYPSYHHLRLDGASCCPPPVSQVPSVVSECPACWEGQFMSGRRGKCQIVVSLQSEGVKYIFKWDLCSLYFPLTWMW